MACTHPQIDAPHCVAPRWGKQYMEARRPRLYRFRITYLLFWQREWSHGLGARWCVPCSCLCRWTTQQVVFVCVELFDILLLWPSGSKGGTWKRQSDTKRNVYAAICTQAEAETNAFRSYLQLQKGLIYYYFIILSARCSLIYRYYHQ